MRNTNINGPIGEIDYCDGIEIINLVTGEIVGSKKIPLILQDKANLELMGFW